MDEAARRETYRGKEGEKEQKTQARQKSKNHTQGVDSSKASRLCYKAERGTLSHDLQSS